MNHYTTEQHNSYGYYQEQQQHDYNDHHEQEVEEEVEQQEGSNKKKRLRIKSHEATNKPKRKRITPYQFSILSDLFSSTDTPNYQLREITAEKLNMTNREVQVWFQNRRAKINRNKLQEQKRHDPFIYPISSWSSFPSTAKSPPSVQATLPSSSSSSYTNQPYYYYTPDNEFDSTSSVTTTTTAVSSCSSTPTLYPQLLPHMRPLDILALAAEYIARCDEEKRLTEEQRRKCWRPWD